MGPLLLARLLELNDTQEGILKNRPSVLSEALGTVTAAFQPTIGPRGGVRDSVATSMAKSAMRAASSQIGRQLVRGVLGGILGGSGRRR